MNNLNGNGKIVHKYVVFKNYIVVFIEDRLNNTVCLSKKMSKLPKMFYHNYIFYGKFYEQAVINHIECVIKPYLVNVITLEKIKSIADKMICKVDYLKIEYCKTNSIYITNKNTNVVYRISDHDTYAENNYKIFPVKFNVGQVVGIICAIIDIEISKSNKN